MTAAVEPIPARTLRLRDVALAAVAEVCTLGHDGASGGQEHDLLRQFAAAARRHGKALSQAFDESLRTPTAEDARLLWLSSKLKLSRLELLAVALAAAVEDDAIVGRVLAHVQAPVGGSRPTLGLLARTFTSVFDPKAAVLPMLLNGPAVRCGLLTVLDDAAPLPERPVTVPAALCLALAGHDSEWAGAAIGLDDALNVPLPDAVLGDAAQHAAALESEPQRMLVLRTGSPSEGRTVALVIANALSRRPVFLETDKVAGLGPWLLLRRLLPVFCYELAPGERRRLPHVPGYQGPVVVVCGPDGSIESAQGAAASWTLPVPPLEGRRGLWLKALGDTHEVTDLAGQLAADHRHGAGRIAHLGRLARHHAALMGHAVPDGHDVVAAAWTGEGSGLDALAEPLRDRIPDEALVVPATLRADLDALMMRCRVREDLAGGLGASASTRYRPGVRALFTGPSGTGKTLASAWIATRLGLPLYRVDLASVTSKYIGETEKNLSQLLARAEQAEVILLFDEADSLFGKRTEIKDSNDRFANAQTNYLLQRIENYDGIVLLTSNSQARFDDAFARRLDFVIDFPLPGPDERRALWRSHLGAESTLTPAELNQLAVLVDLNGGHTRNAVLAAAVRARHARREIAFADLLIGLEAELRKLGRQVPLDLQPGR